MLQVSAWGNEGENQNLRLGCSVFPKQPFFNRLLGVVYWLVNDYANHGLPRQTRIAVVYSRVPHAVEFAQFYETVCVNHRYEAKAFDSSEAAEAWLHSGATA